MFLLFIGCVVISKWFKVLKELWFILGKRDNYYYIVGKMK